MARIHHVARILHSAPGIRLLRMVVLAGSYPMGFFLVLFHHHRSRTHLEVYHPCLHTAHDSRNRTGIQGQISLGRNRDRTFHRASDSIQPHPNDLLLPVCHPVHGHRLFCGRLPQERTPGLLQSQRGADSGSVDRCIRQHFQPLPHLRIQQRDHTRKIRVGKTKL